MFRIYLDYFTFTAYDNNTMQLLIPVGAKYSTGGSLWSTYRGSNCEYLYKHYDSIYNYYKAKDV